MNIYLRFFPFLRPYVGKLALSTVCMLGLVVFSVLSVGLIMPFVDTIFKPVQHAQETQSQQPPPALQHIASVNDLKGYLNSTIDFYIQNYDRLSLLKYLCVFILVSFFLKNLFGYLQSYYMSFVEQGLMRDLRLDMYQHLHRLSLSYFTEEKKGNLISRLMNDVRIVNDSIMAIVNSIFRDPPQIVMYVAILFLFNWRLTLIVFIVVPLTGYLIGKIGDALKRESIFAQEKLADITSILDETLSGIRIVKAFGMEHFEIFKFKKESNRFFQIMLRIVQRRNLASPISEFLGVLTITLILWIMGQAILRGDGEMTPGGFLLYVGMIFQMMQPLKLFSQMFNSYKEGTAAGERVLKILDIEPRIVNKPGAVTLSGLKKKIVFENVRFQYDTGDEVLKGISTEIQKGEIVAIVGPSGSGKSTMVDLLPRFFEVTGGAIFIDGHDIRDVQVESLRNLMGIVAQETILFNDTVRNNIAYGAVDIPDEKVIEAAKVANAHDFIMVLPQGYNTTIGDRGVKLSGGERQRISIARAILKNPPILILDEATSSLDTESEQLVQQAIERLMKGRTSIVIAHRLSTIKHADSILVLESGIIREIGKHSTLVAKKKSLYRKLYDLQFKV